MTLQELMAKILEVCPRAIVSEDSSGELTIATGFMELGDGRVVMIPEGVRIQPPEQVL
jgi:hypothetical protein